LAGRSDSAEGYVAILVIELHFPEAGSLKGKRKDLQSIKALLHGRFGCAVAETGHQDLWQRGRLLATLTSGSLAVLEESVDRTCGWLAARCPTGVNIEQITASVADLRDLASTSRYEG
jgi:uncharacterized protein YlxP (DUF503 family)